MPYEVVVIHDKQAQQSEGDQYAIKQPIVPINLSRSLLLIILPLGVPGVLNCIKPHLARGSLGVVLDLMFLFLLGVCKMNLAFLSIPMLWNFLFMHFRLLLSSIWRPWVAPPSIIICLMLLLGHVLSCRRCLSNPTS